MKCAKTLALFGILMMSSPEWGWVQFVNGIVALRGRRIGNECDFRATDERVEVRHETLETQPVVYFVDIQCRVFLIEIPPLAHQ